MTSSHHAPYVLGYTRTTMVGNRGKRSREAEQTPETRSQFGSQAATRLRESFCGTRAYHLVRICRYELNCYLYRVTESAIPPSAFTIIYDYRFFCKFGLDL